LNLHPPCGHGRPVCPTQLLGGLRPFMPPLEFIVATFLIPTVRIMLAFKFFGRVCPGPASRPLWGWGLNYPFVRLPLRRNKLWMGRKNSPSSRRSSGCGNAPPLSYVRGPSLPSMVSVEASPLGAVVCYAHSPPSLCLLEHRPCALGSLLRSSGKAWPGPVSGPLSAPGC